MLQGLGLAHRTPQLVGEITERRALDDLGRAAIREIRRIGAKIALDDFGTGNSGLQQLIGLEVDILKIDRSFVLGLGRDRSAERLVRGIAALANVLRVGLVAEGVETEAPALFLRAVGVREGAGLAVGARPGRRRAGGRPRRVNAARPPPIDGSTAAARCHRSVLR